MGFETKTISNKIKKDSVSSRYVLSDMERKLMQVVLDPQHFGKPVTEKIKIVGCSRDTYYRIMRKPQVAQFINETNVALIRDNLSPLIQQTLKFAMENKSNYNDRKHLLQMVGMLSSSGNEININNNVNANGEAENVNPFDGLSREQLEALANKYSENVNEVIEDVVSFDEV